MSNINSTFLESYKKDAITALMQMNPLWDEDEVEKIVTKEMEKSFKNPEVEIDNNYTGQHQASSLLTILDWCENKNPIIAGNGTFYKNHYEAVNPIASFLQGMLDRRKAYKKEMFKIGDPSLAKYQDLDLLQSIQKINANS